MSGLLVALWIVALVLTPAVLNYGITFAYFQSIGSPEFAKKEYRQDAVTAVTIGVLSAPLSWIGVLIVLGLSGFFERGVRFK